jgi:hypothetical protein
VNLYRVHIEVSPSLTHPLYWEWASGFLLVCIFADSPEDATSRARAIVSQLPYETGDEIHCGLATDAPSSEPGIAAHEVKDRIAQETARANGLGLLLNVLALEGEEVPPTGPAGPPVL